MVRVLAMGDDGVESVVAAGQLEDDEHLLLGGLLSAACDGGAGEERGQERRDAHASDDEVASAETARLRAELQRIELRQGGTPER